MQPDAVLKKLFRNPRIAELAIRRHFPNWAGRLDFSTLEPLRTEMIAKGGKKRLIDAGWACRTKDGAEELLAHFEFQGKSDSTMALRTTSYRSLMKEDRAKCYPGLGASAPKIHARTLVLHHGDGRWTAPKRQKAAPGEPPRRVAYRVASPRPLGKPDFALCEVVELVMGLARDLSVDQIVAEQRLLWPVVEGDGDEELVRDVDEAVRGLLGWHGFDEVEVESELDKGGRRMQRSAGRARRELDERYRRHRVEGRREGRREGHREGHRTALRRQAAHRFGGEAARKFGDLLDRVDDPDRLDEAGHAVIDCGGADELLTRARSLATAD